jgi:hypothetical protein
MTITCRKSWLGMAVTTAAGNTVSVGFDPACGAACNRVRLWLFVNILRVPCGTGRTHDRVDRIFQVAWTPPRWLQKQFFKLDRRY